MRAADVHVVILTAALPEMRQQNSAAIVRDVPGEGAVQPRQVARRGVAFEDALDANPAFVLRHERPTVLGDVVQLQASRRAEYAPRLSARRRRPQFVLRS